MAAFSKEHDILYYLLDISHILYAMIANDKQKLREKIWKVLEDKKLIRTSRSSRGRIPNFKGVVQAAFKLKNTLEWENSQTVFTSPDSALREIREYVLGDKKVLIIATPKIKEGYLLINPEKVAGREKIASTIKGAFKTGQKIRSFPQVDLVVEGSLAVDLQGNRLGKGGGFADQEISHLFRETVIDNHTPICTPVHSLQVVHQVPVEVHDEKINMILTPEMVIRTNSITLKKELH